MKNRFNGFFILLIFAFPVIAPVGFSAPCLAAENGRPLYFSIIPKKNVDQQIRELDPLLRLLEKNLRRPI